MTFEYVLWFCVAAYALHVVEEKVLDWKKWFDPKVIHFKLETSDFYMVQGVKLLIGFCCAMVGWRAPGFSLAFPAMILFSALFSHIIPALKMRKFNPGLITSIIFLLPLGVFAYMGAYCDMMLYPVSLVISILLGAFIKWAPRIFMKIAKK